LFPDGFEFTPMLLSPKYKNLVGLLLSMDVLSRGNRYE
jgi:hypothetical protein